MRQSILQYLLVFVLGLLPLNGKTSMREISEFSLISINSAITPATYDYLEQSLKKMPSEALVIVKINTPGGLITTTKDIITLFGSQKRPLAIWITPEGASASSAGAIIASAAHFIFMSPGTNMGAATPVGLGDDLKEGDGRKKALNDLTALVRSLNNSRGRPSTPFEKMITGAESFTHSEAFDLKIINAVISHQEEIIDYINGKKIILDGEEMTLHSSRSTNVKEYEASTGQKILEVLANPSTAYFLFLIGVALIYFELQAPGGFIAGAFGVGFLILAGISFQVLPLNWGSMGLIVLGIALLILEVFITSYGLLSLAGIAAFVMGSLFLFDGETGLISIQYPVILSTLIGVFSAVGFLLWYLWRDSKKQKFSGDFFLPTGAIGSVLAVLPNKLYQVKVHGEIWNAYSDQSLLVGEAVIVTETDTQELKIKIQKN